MQQPRPACRGSVRPCLTRGRTGGLPTGATRRSRDRAPGFTRALRRCDWPHRSIQKPQQFVDKTLPFLKNTASPITIIIMFCYFLPFRYASCICSLARPQWRRGRCWDWNRLWRWRRAMEGSSNCMPVITVFVGIQASNLIMANTRCYITDMAKQIILDQQKNVWHNRSTSSFIIKCVKNDPKTTNMSQHSKWFKM